MRIVAVSATTARCEERDGGGSAEVALDFVAGARPGDVVLVHAGVALARVDGEDEYVR
jgi:hydrogenase maturation factor